MAYSPVNSSDTLADSVATLNGAFDLLLGLSHGASAPSSPEAWQPWLDSTSSAATLKIRNGSNNGWIPVHHLETQSGPIASDGTNTVKILGPSSITTSYTLTLPAALPSSGTKYLKVDSSGTISLTDS